jgi:hypothetical protein
MAGCANLSLASQLLVGTRKTCQLKLSKLLVLLGIASIVISACASSTDEPTATVEPIATTTIAVTSVTQDSAFYLNSIQNSAVQVTAAFARISQDLSRVWPTRGALLDAVSNSGVADEMSANMQAIIQLTPPDEFEQEHEILTKAGITVLEYSAQLSRALDDRDLGGMVVGVANFSVSYKRLVLNASPQLCSALGIANDQETLCDVTTSEPGSYDAEVEQLIKEFRLEILPRGSAFPAALIGDERFDTIAALNKGIEIAAQEAERKLGALSAPIHRADDHEILLTFVKDISTTATAITIAGAERDDVRVQQLITQSQQIAEAATSISCEFRETVLHNLLPGCAS